MIDLNISFAGAGRVASALAIRISEAGYNVERIVSPTAVKGQALASDCSALWSDKLQFPPTTDLIIVAVPDHKLHEVLSTVRCNETTSVVHTAGSFGLDIFPPHIIRKGVFYPLQTFTSGRTTDLTDLPFLLEASNEGTASMLYRLAESLGGMPRFINSEQRMMIHTAAVFICNFTNHMLTAGSRIAQKGDIPFDIFIPLLRETISKAIEMGPEISQTGPAVRNDLNTIEKHLELLSSSPEFKKIYKEVSESIINFYKKS
jgi:predicted short-subunit dehydrogenase-like oxidoreductase (DUF2520 family)